MVLRTWSLDKLWNMTTEKGPGGKIIIYETKKYVSDKNNKHWGSGSRNLWGHWKITKHS